MRYIPKPPAGEFAPYAILYIDLLPDDGFVLDHMQTRLHGMKDLAQSCSEVPLTQPFAAGEQYPTELFCLTKNIKG